MDFSNEAFSNGKSNELYIFLSIIKSLLNVLYSSYDPLSVTMPSILAYSLVDQNPRTCTGVRVRGIRG